MSFWNISHHTPKKRTLDITHKYFSSYWCRDGNALTPHLFALFVTYLPRNSSSPPPPLSPMTMAPASPSSLILPICCLCLSLPPRLLTSYKSPCNPNPANNRKTTWRRPPSPTLVLYLTQRLSFLLIPMTSMISFQLGISKPTNIYQDISETWKLYKHVRRYLDILK